MRRNKALLVFFSTILVCGHLFAGTSNTEPLSGLNLEDFDSKVSQDNKWDSNPFVKYGDALQPKQLTLYGIVYSPEKSMALINSDIVKVGDKLGTSEIIAIEKQKVILRNSDGLFQITLKGAQNEKT